MLLLVRSSFTRGSKSDGMKCPAAPVCPLWPLMFTQLSLTSMTFLGDTQELFSTLSIDSSVNFFGFNFDFLQWRLLVNSSFSLSSNKHHACNSSSSSRTSSLMSTFVFFYSVHTPVPSFPWCNLPQRVLFSPQLQQTLVSPLPPLSLSCPFPPFLPPVLDHCTFPSTIRSYSHLC